MFSGEKSNRLDLWSGTQRHLSRFSHTIFPQRRAMAASQRANVVPDHSQPISLWPVVPLDFFTFFLGGGGLWWWPLATNISASCPEIRGIGSACLGLAIQPCRLLFSQEPGSPDFPLKGKAQDAYPAGYVAKLNLPTVPQVHEASGLSWFLFPEECTSLRWDDTIAWDNNLSLLASVFETVQPFSS